MDTQTFVTYQITDAKTGERFDVYDEYLARQHYGDSDHVTEVHTTVTISAPFHKTTVKCAKIWHENGNFNHELEEEYP